MKIIIQFWSVFLFELLVEQLQPGRAKLLQKNMYSAQNSTVGDTLSMFFKTA